MTHRPISLIDQRSVSVAALDVQFRDDHFEGLISLEAVSSPLRQLFEQFEEIVEGQMFSLLDDIEEKIEVTRFRVVFENGSVASLSDLQVYPSTNAISFKIRQPATVQRQEVHSAPSNSPAVHSDPDIMGGVPVFVGTRVPLQNLLDYLCGGDPLAEFLDDFPSVSREQAVAALRQAAQALVDHARPA